VRLHFNCDPTCEGMCGNWNISDQECSTCPEPSSAIA
jgi:hypothetical protein